MQTIWARALQVKSSCNCHFCASSRHVLTRRVNTPPVRRKLQFGDYLTACYSSIFAGAVCFDAKRKQDKREALDRAIESARSEVEALNEDQRKRLEAIGCEGEDNLQETARRKTSPKNFHRQTLDLIQALGLHGGQQYHTQRSSSPPGYSPDLRESVYMQKGDIRMCKGHQAASVDPTLSLRGSHPLPLRGRSEEEIQSPTLEQKVSLSAGMSSAGDEDGPGVERDVQSVALSKPEDPPETKIEPDAPNQFPGASNNLSENAKTTLKESVDLSSPFRGEGTFRIQNYPYSTKEDLAARISAHEYAGNGSSKQSALNHRYTTTSTDFWSAGTRIGASSPKMDLYKQFLGPASRLPGRSPEDVWSSLESSYVSARNIMQREAAISRLVYTLLLSYLTSPEVDDGTWPRIIRLDMTDGRSVDLSNGNRAELIQKIEDLSYRLRVLAGLRKTPSAISSMENVLFPRYQPFNEQDRQSEASYVAVQNDALREIFVQSRSPNTLFSRLCSALLSQNYAPNIHTYNVLIILLCRAQFFGAAQHVIDALNSSSINHNEVTYAAVLNCYTYLSQSSSFRAYLNRMDGVAGSPVRVSFNKEEVSNTLEPSLYLPSARDLSIGSLSSSSQEIPMYRERARRNIAVREAIIIGWLDIGNFDKAMSEYLSMLSSGTSATQPILEALLQYSVKTANWEVGSAIWGQIKVTSRPIPVLFYYWMLQLCVLCQRSDQFELVLQDGLYHQVLLARLHYCDFELNSIKQATLVARAFGVRTLEQDVWMPGFSRSTTLAGSQELPQLPNLYLMILIRFIDLVEAKYTELGWFTDSKGWILKASNELRRIQSKGGFRDERMLSKATWLSAKFKAEQGLGVAAGTIAPLRHLENSSLDPVLPDVPQLKLHKFKQRKRFMKIDLSRFPDEKTADVLRAYLSKLEKPRDSSNEDRPVVNMPKDPLKRRSALFPNFNLVSSTYWSGFAQDDLEHSKG